MAAEVCVGCGTLAPQHPIVGVAKVRDEFAAFPVCEKCWRDPENRKVVLKMHFFERRHAKIAVAMAGSNTLG